METVEDEAEEEKSRSIGGASYEISLLFSSFTQTLARPCSDVVIANRPLSARARFVSPDSDDLNAIDSSPSASLTDFAFFLGEGGNMNA